MDETKPPGVTLFPEERLNPYFPIQLWAIGWLGILKSCIWIFTDPSGLQEPLTIMGLRYLVMTLPLFFFSVGLFHKKKWSAWGMGFSAMLEILFFLSYRDTLSTLVLDHLTPINLVFSVIIFIINGPLSDVIILITIPFILRYTRS
jgi:hypothetical protein